MALKKYKAPYKIQPDDNNGLENFDKQFTDLPINSYENESPCDKNFTNFSYDANVDNDNIINWFNQLIKR